jgi:arsenate reductase (thioredoxin)
VTAERPQVLFVCVHNAGRSQMAAAFLSRLGEGRIDVRSAGSTPAEEIHPVVVQAMEEVGIDLSAERPKRIDDDVVHASDVVITMGCGDACPIYPGKRYEDWKVEDPSGRSLEEVRTIRNDLERRVSELVSDLAS